MQIYFYNPDDFDSFGTAVLENRVVGAMAVFFQVSLNKVYIHKPKLSPSTNYFIELFQA